MKKSTRFFKNTVVLLCLLISISTLSQTTFHTANFETTTDGWTMGGANAIRTNDATYAYSGNWSIQLRASGASAAISSPSFSLSTYDKIDLKFFFSSYDMEATETFFIEYKPSLIGAWTTIATFVANDITSPNQGDFLRDDFTKSKYSKTVTLLKTAYSFPILAEAQFRITCNGSDGSDRVYIDLITVTGTTFTTPTTGPGGITSNLDLWLRGDKLDGSTVGTDGNNVSKWTDIGKGNHAETVVAGQEPVYRNNSSDNFNFNPVIEFENDYNTAGRDLKYINTRDELSGTDGFNSNDIFIVLVPDYPINNTMYPMDTFTGHDPTEATYSEDVTGIGFGDYSQRFTGEYFAYAQGTSSGVGVGYGRADTSGTIDFTKIGIYNARHNTANSSVELFLNANTVCNTDSDIPDFTTVNDSKFHIGRSQHFNGSFGGRIAEIITYDSRKNDVTERNRIESYLALKYGLTLGTNGTSMNYVDSNGNTVWDATVNAGYNYDIAGIFRDDASNHQQKQSKSVNETSDGTGLLTGILTMGLSDISSTNSANTNTFGGDRQYLVWGNDGTAITAPAFTVGVDMSDGISGLTTPVTFDGMQRIWKVVENGNGGDIPSVKVSIPQNAVRNISPPGSYLMFISDTNIFDPTADYRVMTPDGSGNLETEYDFDGTKYITFGYAPQVIVERSVYFDGSDDYIDVGDHKDLNSTGFTVSAWIKRSPGSGNTTVFSKRDATYTKGYDAKITWGGNFEMSWINGTKQTITGSTFIPENEWHHVSVIFDSGTTNLYIDGVLDQTATLSSPVSTNESFIIAAAGKTSTSDWFIGNIDEVRIWDVALSEDQLHYIMNQEIEDNATFVDGMVLPTSITRNETGSIPWSDLVGYYPMSIYTYTNTNDHSDNQNQGALRNLDTVDFQTAPLPYESNANGNWDNAATWLNGSVNKIPGSTSIDWTNSVNWNIVRINHNITVDNYSTVPASNNLNRTLLGLIVDSNELTVGATPYDSFAGFGLTVTHYLELNGSIDLEGESQLIQTDNSVLVVGGSGSLERDQQGTADTYTYNYWSSPVGVVNTTSNNDTYASSFTLPNVLNDGTTATSPGAISFLTSGYNGTASPFGIADYWIWKFANLQDGNYSLWQHMRSTGSILAGEGYTMKGPGTGTLLTPQNYVFNGKPNNGDITLAINAGNDYLVGNPYPSAINAHEFLSDNTHTNGTLYFWEHWGGGSHNLGDYQGGYALLNFSGATPTPSYALSDADVNQTGGGTKLPGQYIPVSQGFFVYSAGGGTMKFENDQRVFEKEGATSTFMRTNSESNNQPEVDYNEDGRMKFRIGFDSFNGIHRQILLTVDENATANLDWGYDGKLNGNQIDDMYWMIEEGKYGIQGLNMVTEETVAPLGIHVRDNGMNYITIDHLENIPNDVEIYAYDSVLNIYHDLRQSDYEVYLTTGSYLNRFAIVFTIPNSTVLSNDEFEANSTLEVFYSSDDKNLDIHNPNLIKIESLELFNVLGQSIYFSNEIETQNNTKIKVSNLSTGTYIINLITISGKISKKVLVK